MNKEIGALTGLRGIAAIWVVLHHAQSILSTAGAGIQEATRLAFRGGYLGVDLFFVLSGFVLALNYGERGLLASPRSYAGFLWKRLARIYPAHIAALVLFAVAIMAHIVIGLTFVTKHDLSAGALLQSLTLVHAWAVPITGKWNAVSWSISAEWAAYLAFPLIAYVAHLIQSRVILWLSVVGVIAALGLWFEVNNGANGFSYGLVRIAAEFSAGVMLFRLWKISDHHGAAADRFALLSLLILIVGAGFLDHAFDYDNKAQAYGPAVACAVVYCLASARGPFERFLSSPSMLHLGRISYSLYLVHMSFIGLAISYMQQTHPNTSGLQASAVLFSALLASLLCAHWFYVSIEEPSRRGMLRLAQRRGNAAAGAVNAAV